jgi:hypothetical protein
LGNKHKDIGGYVLIKDYTHPNRNSHNEISEHVKIMSNKLKRPLKKGEVVHHINFIRDDNRKRNLYLFESTSRHIKAASSIFRLVDTLLKQKLIIFKKGVYMMRPNSPVGGK